jgi:hypothetical protein
MLAMLARTYTLQERGEEALPLQRQAVALLAEDPSVDDLERATEMQSLIEMELLHGSPEQAEVLVLEVVELRRAAGEEADTAQTLAAVAQTAVATANFEAAERLAEQALAADSASGSSALTARTVLADVAWMRVRRGSTSVADLLMAADDSPELGAAEERLSGLYDLLKSEAPEDLTRRAETADRLARVNAVQGDAEGAAEWLRRELELIESGAAQGRTPAAVRADLVELLAAAGRLDEAVEVNASLIAELENSYGTEDARLLPPLEQQQELLTKAKRRKEARAVKKRIKKLKKALR